MTAATSKPRAALIAFISDDVNLSVIRDYAASQGLPTDQLFKGTIDDATGYLREHTPPDMLIVEISNPAEAGAKLDALADVCDAHVKVVVVSTANEFSFYRWLMDIGIYGYLLKPFDRAAVEAIFRKAPAGADTKESKQPGKVTTVLGTRGGVGTTTIAVNLAYALAHGEKKPAAILDLDAQLGSVAMALDLEPTRGLRDAFEKPERIDSIFLDRLMSRRDELLSVLGVEEALEEPMNPNPLAAEALIREARLKFNHIVVDLPRNLNAFAKEILKSSDKVILVTELSLAGLRDTMRMLDFCRNHLKITAPLIVSNRDGLSGKGEMPKGDFEKNLGLKIHFHIPHTMEAYSAAATGETLLEMAPKSKFSSIINELASNVADKAHTVAAAPVKASLLKIFSGDKKK